MAYNFYKNPPQSDFERELREWNDSQPLNPSTYEDGTRITSGSGQVEFFKPNPMFDTVPHASVMDEEKALKFADFMETDAGGACSSWNKEVRQRIAADIRARVAEMRRLREEADKKKLAEAAILSHEELVEVATRQVRYTGVQPLPPSHSAEDILAEVVDDLCVPGDILELADHLRETGEAST